jgi:glutathione S-transferase
MQRTPAQSAERRDPSTGQQGPSSERSSQSAERQDPPAEQRSQSEERRERSRQEAEQIRTKYADDIERHGPPEDQVMSILDGYSRMRVKTLRALDHLKSQAKALKEAVIKAKEKSIKRQLNFLNSAFKEYQSTCGQVLEDIHMMGCVWNRNTTLLEWLMAWGQEDYDEAMSWVDDFFERQEKEKAAQEA